MYTQKMTLNMLSSLKNVELPNNFALEKKKYTREDVRNLIALYKKKEEQVLVVPEIKKAIKREEVVINETKKHCIIERKIVEDYPMFQGKEVSTGEIVFYLDVCGWVYKKDLEFFRKIYKIED